MGTTCGTSPGVGQETRHLDAVVRDYLGPGGGDDVATCDRCAEELAVSLDYGSGQGKLRVKVECGCCGEVHFWTQSESEGPWDPLHLRYFLERVRADQEVRCPYDDCFVTYGEYPDGWIEFRCLYCNRRGRVYAGRSAGNIAGAESLVLLTLCGE